VPAALEQLGADVLFHRVAIRPGKPILFARLPNGTLVFGLPGNPIAVAVGLRFFVVPALRKMQGLPDEIYLTASVKDSVGKKRGLRFFAKASASSEDSGQLQVAALPGQESFKISPLMTANCWLIAEEDTEEVSAGTLVKIAPLYPGSFP
jgi:molybdopterin molybdotransferase